MGKEEKKPRLCELGTEVQQAFTLQKEGSSFRNQKKAPKYQGKYTWALVSDAKKDINGERVRVMPV